MYFDIEASGKRINKLRLKNGMTQEELSGRLHISERYLRRLEKGACGGSIDLLVDIAELFHVSLDYLILGKCLQSDQIRHEIHRMAEQLLCLEQQIK